MNEKILLTGSAARYLGLSYQSIYNHIAKGNLQDRRTENGWRFFLFSELEELRKKMSGVKVASGGRGRG